MTPNQQIFCDEYVKDRNGTRAYMAAYPRVTKKEVAYVNASRMLRNAKVKRYIDEQLERIHTENTADAAEVMEYLTRVIRGTNASEIVVTLGMCGGGSEAVRMNKHPDEREKLKAAELLGKNLGLFDQAKDTSNESLEKLDAMIEGINNAAEY